MTWNQHFRASLEGREELELPQLREMFSVPARVATERFLECLMVFQQEYDVSFGLLRPDDSLGIFLEPSPTKNPFRWLFARARAEDRASELNFRLFKERKRWRAPTLKAGPQTIGEYVRAWCGAD